MAVKLFSNIISQMMHGFWDNWRLGYRLCRRGIKSQYAHSKLSILWDFFDPLVYCAVFIFLHKAASLNVGDIRVPYAVFLVPGMMLWQTFMESLTMSLNSISGYSDLLGFVVVAPEALMIATFFRVGLNTLLRLIIILLVIIFFHTFSWINFILFLAVLPTIFLLGFSIGLLLAPFNSVMNDIGRAVSIILRPLMFICGIVIPLKLGPFLLYNPIANIIGEVRDVLLFGHFYYLNHFIAFVEGVFILFLIAWYVYHVTMDIAAQWN